MCGDAGCRGRGRGGGEKRKHIQRCLDGAGQGGNEDEVGVRGKVLVFCGVVTGFCQRRVAVGVGRVCVVEGFAVADYVD